MKSEDLDAREKTERTENGHKKAQKGAVRRSRNQNALQKPTKDNEGNKDCFKMWRPKAKSAATDLPWVIFCNPISGFGQECTASN